MPRNMTPEQNKAWGERMREIREAKKAQDHEVPTPLSSPEPFTPQEEPEVASGPASGPVSEDYEIIGASADVHNEEVRSILESISEDSEVDIYNPLDQGFRIQFGITTYQPLSLNAQERELRDKASLPYYKDMNQTLGRAVKNTVLPPHRVTRLPGKVAHVAIKQLRNYLIRTTVNEDGRAGDVADPTTLRQFEEKIVLKISNTMEAMQVDEQHEIDRRIAELNRV